ncbi:22530_t:CDS:2, partial [Racocetra persica]
EKANSTNKAAICKYCIDHFGFQQVNNLETKTFFLWLGKFIKLPSCQSLLGRILKDTTKEITQAQVAMAQQDSHGIIVAFDGELHHMHQLTKLKKLEEKYNNTNTNKQAKLNQELSSIYSNDINKDNIETFLEDLDNE